MGRFLNVTIGYEMEEEEMLKILRENLKDIFPLLMLLNPLF